MISRCTRDNVLHTHIHIFGQTVDNLLSRTMSVGIYVHAMNFMSQSLFQLSGDDLLSVFGSIVLWPNPFSISPNRVFMRSRLIWHRDSVETWGSLRYWWRPYSRKSRQWEGRHRMRRGCSHGLCHGDHLDGPRCVIWME